MLNSKAIRFSIQLVAVIFVASFATMAMASDDATDLFVLTTDEICVLDVTAAGDINIVAPGTGGETPANPSDNASYAQYTSTVASGVTRSLQAKFGAAEASLTGTHLTLVASGMGTNEGSATSAITVSATSQDIVTGIGSCATGIGGTDGANLTYTVVIDDATALVASETKNINMTLTLTDAA